MRHQDQVAQARKLLSYLDMRTTAMAESVYRNPVSDYTCPRQAGIERDVLIRRGPINIGLGCLLPNPGDWMTHDYTGVPILLVRQPGGMLSASLNVCRHRGARVAEGCGSGAGSFSCPYHGWTYGLDGALAARPDERSFTGLDRATAGLRSLPVVEKYGMVWVCPTPGVALDVDGLLGGLATDLAAYGFDTFHHYETRVLQRRINWKLAVDTFLESYHISPLHYDTIGPLYYSNRNTFDGFGRNLRWILPRRSIGELRSLPESQWDLISQSIVVYLLFPNTVLVMAQDHLETWHLFPAGNGVDETRMYVSLYTPEPALTDSAKRHWNNNFDLAMATVENQDFPVSEGIQRGFYSGAQDEIIFGRNEPALQHYHEAIKSALARARRRKQLKPSLPRGDITQKNPASRFILTTGRGAQWEPLDEGETEMTEVSMPQPSYVHGASQAPLIGATIGEYFDAIVEQFGERDALIARHQQIRWSWTELKQRVDAFAAGLMALGLKPGERIGIWSPNNAEWVVTQFATAKAGLILVNINPAYRISELEYALNKAGCTALVTAARFKTSDYLAMLGELAPELAIASPGRLCAARLPDLRLVITIGGDNAPGALGFDRVYDLGGAAERDQLAALAGQLQFDDPINIQFTSGTTGFPKGATLSHHNILNNAFWLGEAMKFTEADRVCIPVPLYHCFGMVIGNLGCLTHGAAMVLPSEGFDPLATLQAIAAERCTAVYGVPTMFIAEMDHPDFDSFDLSSLRTGIMAGSPCPIEVMKKAVDRMHLAEIVIGYGMTETSPLSFISATDDPLERRVSTVGRVTPHVEAKIVDAEGRVVPRGTPGELLTRGYLVMLGYWNDEEKTREAINPARWMKTGDLATIDDEGYCNIVGRIKDMVIRGGENVYPREIEEFLYRHPKIRDVQVIGVPDRHYGEELCAWMRLRDGQTATVEEIRDFCRGQIAHYKIPRYVKFVDGFPMTVTGKIQKFAMREEMIAELDLAIEKTA